MDGYVTVRCSKCGSAKLTETAMPHDVQHREASDLRLDEYYGRGGAERLLIKPYQGDAHDYIVNLTGVPNAQYITVTLTNVHDADNNSGNISQQMGVLIGDTTVNGIVNSTDVSQVKSQSGNAVTSSNFTKDVTANGTITSSDVSLVKSKSGSALPSAP